MTQMMGVEMSENGSRWARTWLIIGVCASVAGNVANACLTETAVSILLRIPMAVVWPMFLFGGIEVLVRNRDASGFLARIGQGALLIITVPTAVTSYLNLHALMVKANEPGIAQLTGPLAIDGLMLGCTIMLLASRVLDTRDMGQDSVPMDTEDLDTWTRPVPDMDTVTADNAESWTIGLSSRLGDVEPVLPAPVSGPPAPSKVVRAIAHPDMDHAIEGLRDAGVPTPKLKRDVAEVYGVTTKTVGRRLDKLKA